ncbi:MAG: hypothetical protein EZS28_042203 [Streblomastix strix]|uniref:Uncharacterized protein n=1 Tax=Streblomastix strix TaxID=222440 RepID=A0A5J4TW38_9EUKA|nr:MAG: hypothetical protein EZS28_042203 [Streblomastix strix]
MPCGHERAEISGLRKAGRNEQVERIIDNVLATVDEQDLASARQIYRNKRVYDAKRPQYLRKIVLRRFIWNIWLICVNVQ